MPFPLIVVIIAALLGGGAAAAVVFVNWNRIKAEWEAKRLAVLGAEQSGKTILIKFLTDGRIPDRYEPTQAAERTRANLYRLEDLHLKIRRSTDVPGLRIAMDQWKEVVKDADVVLYLVRANLLLEEDDYARKRLVDDTEILRSFLINGSKKRACFIIGTWADQIPGYRNLDGEGLVALGRRFAEHPMIKKAVQALRTKQSEKVAVIIGSQERTADQQKLAVSLLNALKKD